MLVPPGKGKKAIKKDKKASRIKRRKLFLLLRSLIKNRRNRIMNQPKIMKDKKGTKDPFDISNEDIAKDIEKTLYGTDNSIPKKISKILTFTAIFGIYLYISLRINTYGLRILFIFLGLIFVVMIFQTIVLPSLRKHDKKLKA